MQETERSLSMSREAGLTWDFVRAPIMEVGDVNLKKVTNKWKWLVTGSLHFILGLVGALRSQDSSTTAKPALGQSSSKCRRPLWPRAHSLMYLDLTTMVVVSS